jgi:hypothetical protein
MSILNYLLIDPTERLRLGIQVTGRLKEQYSQIIIDRTSYVLIGLGHSEGAV